MQHFIEWLIPAAQAHEKWFVEANPIVPASDIFTTVNPFTIGVAAALLALTAALTVADRRFERSAWHAVLERKVRPLRDHAAGFLAVATSITLFWMSAHGALLADNLVVPTGTVGTALLGSQVVIAALLLIGLYTAAAAMGLIVLYAALFFLFPAPDVLDYLHYAGIGIFLLAFARGRFSLDWLLGKGMLTDAATRKRAYLAMRLLTGVTMIILALIKWNRPELHFALMDAYPDFNPYTILQGIGFTGLSRETYVFALFLVELTAGLVILSGLLTRIAAFFLLPVFMGSVIFIGAAEIFGHLPFVGILIVLVVFGDRYHKTPDTEWVKRMGMKTTG